MTKMVNVTEERRSIGFDNGKILELHNVVGFNPWGTHLRLWSDEGLVIVNTDHVLYHIVHKNRTDEQ